MAYNSNLPADHSPIASVELRQQFIGLYDLQQQGDADTLSASAANVDAVEPLSLTLANPPTQAEVQAIVDKLNELISALHR